MLADPFHRVVAADAGELGDTGKRRSGAPDTAAASDLDSEASHCELMGLLERAPCFFGI